MDTVRTVKLIGTSLAVASLGLTAFVSAAFAGKMDALLGDWDLNIAKSRFEPRPPMKKYTMKVIAAGTDHLLIKSDWIEADGTADYVEIRLDQGRKNSRTRTGDDFRGWQNIPRNGSRER